MPYLKAKQETFLKSDRNQASTLPDENKHRLKAGDSYFYGEVISTKGNHTLYGYWVFTAHIEAKSAPQIAPSTPSRKVVVSADEFYLDVPYFSQRDNIEEYWRTCNTSSCAMCLKYFDPGAIASDDEYYRRVIQHGDTTDHNAQTKALASYGIKSEFLRNLDYVDLDKALAQEKPIVLGILHRGNIQNPQGGHIIVCVGKWKDGYIFHDPWGSLNDGYATTNGKYVYYSLRSLDSRWLENQPNNGWGRLF